MISHPPPMKCFTCDQPLLEGTEQHPGFFMQSHLQPTEQAMPYELVQSVQNILYSLDALCSTHEKASEVDTNLTDWLQELGAYLAEEGWRRLAKLQDIIEQWDEACQQQATPCQKED